MLPHGIPASYREAIEKSLTVLCPSQMGKSDTASALLDTLENRWMPKPIWAEQGFSDDPARAWAALQADMNRSDSNHRPFGVYVHVPFCQSRCGYCDCYAFPVKAANRSAIPDYFQSLTREIDLWYGVESLGRRQVSTVHFGGGTPLMAGSERLIQIVDQLRAGLRITEETELALETTSSMLTERALDELWQAGFTRLHVGVQSLQDPVRKAIGRHESAEIVLRKICTAVERGWTVSTDVIIGLPDYDAPEIMQDIDRMVAAGVQGFSVYELVYSARNHAFFEGLGLLNQPIVEKFSLFQLVFLYLEAQGFRKNIYNHLSRPEDDNRYFTGPLRNEDLLGLGTIADGFFGDYHYRHAELNAYRRQVADGLPGLAGGIRRSPAERGFRKLEVQIRSGRPDPLVFVQVLGEEKALALFRDWIRRGLIQTMDDDASCELTAAGAWFIGAMLSVCKAAVAVSAAAGVF